MRNKQTARKSTGGKTSARKLPTKAPRKTAGAEKETCSEAIVVEEDEDAIFTYKGLSQKANKGPRSPERESERKMADATSEAPKRLSSSRSRKRKSDAVSSGQQKLSQFFTPPQSANTQTETTGQPLRLFLFGTIVWFTFMKVP